ncbi:hypothetical protein Tcan_15384 [Toxocara canis]|nr:hypothetical protein Tcan_15384 [Toxocara canis]
MAQRFAKRGGTDKKLNNLCQPRIEFKTLILTTLLDCDLVGGRPVEGDDCCGGVGKNELGEKLIWEEAVFFLAYFINNPTPDEDGLLVPSVKRSSLFFRTAINGRERRLLPSVNPIDSH